MLLCLWRFIMSMRVRLFCYSAGVPYVMSERTQLFVTLSLGSVRYAALCTLCQRESGCFVTLPLRSTLCQWENPVVLLLCHCALYVMSMRESSCLVTLPLHSTLCQRESSCFVTLPLRSTLCQWENPVVLVLCHCALYVMSMRESSCLGTLPLRSVRYVNERIQLSSYSATAFYVMSMR